MCTVRTCEMVHTKMCIILMFEHIFHTNLIFYLSELKIHTKMFNVRTFVTHEYEIFFVGTYVTYENIIWPNLCYTQNIISCICTYFTKCIMSISVLLFSEFGQRHIKMFKKVQERGSFSLVLRFGPRHSLY